MPGVVRHDEGFDLALVAPKSFAGSGVNVHRTTPPRLTALVWIAGFCGRAVKKPSHSDGAITAIGFAHFRVPARHFEDDKPRGVLT